MGGKVLTTNFGKTTFVEKRSKSLPDDNERLKEGK